MTFRRRTWEECGLLWWAKGYKLDTLGDAFAKRFGEARGYGRSTLGEKAKTQEEAPREVVDFVWSDELLPILPGESRRKYEVVKRGLEADDPVDLAELARQAARAAIAQQPEVGPALGALEARLAERFSSLPELLERLDAHENKYENKLNDVRGAVDGVGAEVKSIQGAVDGVQKHVGASADQTNKRLDRVIQVASLNVILLAVGFSVLFMLQCQSMSSAGKSTTPNVTVRVGIGSGAAEGGVVDEGDSQGLRSVSTGTGKKVRYVPHHALPRQAVSPCRGSEKTLYGACWMKVDATAPCPPDLYQEGNACYFPVGEDPKEPVGEEAPAPKP